MLTLALLLACTDRDDRPPVHTGDDDDDHSGTVATSGHTGDTAGTWTGTTGEVRTDEEVLLEGFLWGYTLVFSMRTTHDKPYNRINWNLQPPDERADHVPNPDVLYGLAPVDLGAEPAVVHTTDLTDRYWCLQFSDLFAETFHYVGTRATGGLGGDYLLVPPGWSGAVPKGHTVIQAPSRQVALLGRIHVRDDADIPTAAALTAGISVLPLSVAQGGGTPADAEPWPWGLDRDATGLNGIAFWDELGRALELSPARAEEQHIVDGLARYGIGPGRMPSVQVVDPELRALLARIPGEGVEDVAEATASYKTWTTQLGLGQFEGDWLTRAAWAYDGWITHAQEEAVYARSGPLDGSAWHTLHFDPGELPPTGDFWSISVYTMDGHLVGNPFDRFSLQDSNVSVGTDGSIDLNFAPTYPGGETRNWLPTPSGAQFSVALRMYLPEAAVLDGSWQPPEIAPAP